MLSVLIPTYNRSCYVLAKTLSQQCASVEGLVWEIVLIDDASTDAVTRASNKWCETMDGVRVVWQRENMGRAAVRNFAVGQAKYDWLLFLDDDVMPQNENFISKYVKLALKNKYDVICGGVLASKDEDESSLRWIYDAYCSEKQTIEWRRNNPYQCFSAANFMVRKSVFEHLRFDETIAGYGYEDALFGIGLEQKRMRIRHSANPVLHLGLETNEVFMKKTESALNVLHSLGKPMTERASVARTCAWLEQRHLGRIIRAWHAVFGSLERRLLCSKLPSVHLFQLYKLGYYARLR